MVEAIWLGRLAAIARRSDRGCFGVAYLISPTVPAKTQQNKVLLQNQNKPIPVLVEQRLRTLVLPHHKQPASENGDRLQHH
jgi:hypothetical protein